MGKKTPNTGDKSFSINTEKLDSNYTSTGVTFYFYTILCTLIAFYFLHSVRMQIFSYPGRGGEKYGDNAVRNRILNITHSLDQHFQALYFDCPVANGKRFYGLTSYSYLILFILYGTAFLTILLNFMRNYLFQNLFQSVQQNPDVNPYKNPNTVSKIEDSPSLEAHAQYSKLIGKSFILLSPILIYYIVRFCEWTQLDIQRNFALKLAIFLAVFLPPIFVIATSYQFNYLAKGEKYFEEKDKSFVKEMDDRLVYQFVSIYYPLFLILIVISLYLFAYREMNDSKLWLMGIFFLFAFIPIISIFFLNSILFGDYQDPLICTEKGYSNNIEIATKTGVHNIYQATVKYNYPCFFK